MKKNLINLVLCIIFIMILSACSTSYDTMMDSFNKKFSPTSTSKVKDTPSPSDSDFQPEKMLTQEVYQVPSSILLILQGPSDCKSYKWVARVPKAGNDGEISETVIGSEKVLSYQMPGVFRESVENVLVLTVVGNNGVEYTDKANIVLYKMD